MCIVFHYSLSFRFWCISTSLLLTVVRSLKLGREVYTSINFDKQVTISARAFLVSTPASIALFVVAEKRSGSTNFSAQSGSGSDLEYHKGCSNYMCMMRQYTNRQFDWSWQIDSVWCLYLECSMVQIELFSLLKSSVFFSLHAWNMGGVTGYNIKHGTCRLYTNPYTTSMTAETVW